VVLENSKVLIDFIQIVDFDLMVIISLDKFSGNLFTPYDLSAAQLSVQESQLLVATAYITVMVAFPLRAIWSLWLGTS
jgi:hypothetical protein